MDSSQQPAQTNQQNNTSRPLSPLDSKSFNKRKLWACVFGVVFILLITIVLGVVILTRKSNTTESNLEKEDVFKRLTKNSWCNKTETANSSGGFPPTSKNYIFNANGTYEWSHVSDYPEDGGSGNWNFQKTTAAGGSIFFDSGDVVRFTLNENSSLSLEAMVLDACEPLNGPSSYSSDTLPKVEPTVTFKQITVNPWYKTNDFDLYRLPSKIELKANGTYVAEFNNGECSYTGFWSLRSNQIIRQVPTDNCDFRKNDETSFSSYEVQLDKDTIVFEGALYSATQDQKTGIILSDLRYSIAEVKITYQRPVQAGVKNILNVELKNINLENVTLKNFVIFQEKYKRTDDGYSTVGAKSTVASQNFTSLVLAPGQVHSFPLDITFSGSEDIGVTIEANFELGAQAYSAYESYVYTFLNEH